MSCKEKVRTSLSTGTSLSLGNGVHTLLMLLKSNVAMMKKKKFLFLTKEVRLEKVPAVAYERHRIVSSRRIVAFLVF